MQAFIWDQRFETGIALVDQQHRQLVDTTNLLGDKLLRGDIEEAELQALFHQLADYARHHFADEEALMHSNAVDERHIREHARHHRQFVEQVVSMWRARATMKNPAEALHGYLASWLTVHILGEDHAMARQMADLQRGLSASEAYEREAAPHDTSTDVLLEALGRLYGLLAEQNRNLAEANQQLETRIAERTADLTEANRQLAAEQAELTRLLHKVEEAQQQLLQSEKMAAIGQLAAGVAHEINNPVGFVNSNFRTLRVYITHLLQLIDAYESGDPAQIAQARQLADLNFLREDLPFLLEESLDGLNRVTHIVQDLKDFSRVDQAEHQHADLNAALRSTLNVVHNELKYKAEIVLELGELPLVDCYPAQLNQAFMNLLVNAAQAIAERGRIVVRSGCEAEHIWFEIEDNGCGMEAATVQHIFEPFYTTKPVGKGTGLGLSITYDIIVKKHHGALDVRSTPGAGTCFRITLPINPPAQNSSASP